MISIPECHSTISNVHNITFKIFFFFFVIWTLTWQIRMCSPFQALCVVYCSCVCVCSFVAADFVSRWHLVCSEMCVSAELSWGEHACTSVCERRTSGWAPAPHRSAPQSLLLMKCCFWILLWPYSYLENTRCIHNTCSSSLFMDKAGGKKAKLVNVRWHTRGVKKYQGQQRQNFCLKCTFT